MPQKTKTTSAPVELTAFYQTHGFQVDLIPVPKKQAADAQHQKWFQQFNSSPWEALFQFGFLPKERWMSPSMAYLHFIADRLIRRLSSQPDIELMREAAEAPLSREDMDQLKEALPFVGGMEYVDDAWITEVWNRLLKEFAQQMKEYDGTAAAFFAERNAGISVAGRVFFHLVEDASSSYPFAFMATYSTRPVKSKKAIHTPLKHALAEFRGDQKKLLELMSTVGKAADKSNLISSLVESGELFSPIRFTSGEAYTFLREIPVYEEAGIMCRVPDWWRKRTNRIKLTLSTGEKPPSRLGLDAILDFGAALTIDGEPVTPEQLKEFLTMAEGLIQYKGKWVEISKNKLQAALDAFEKAGRIAEGGGLTMAEAMRLELNPEKEALSSREDLEISVSNGAWLKELRETLVRPTLLPDLETEKTFTAQLRPYQMNGYRWLDTMSQLGFGACLADDMGLGKTVQAISFLEHYRLTRGGHALLILPASLMGNWQKELERFAPELPFQILHKSAQKNREELAVDEDAFLCVTTYGMITRMEALSLRSWDVVVLDEAQAIKNAGTRQSKTVRSIHAPIRIAMTGTPIENRLGDLWSLFDFLNKGLLGTAKEFTEFTKTLGDNQANYARLRGMVGPFILRRLKTDRSIISDLPDKLEKREYAALSKKQMLLYARLVKEIESKLANSQGIERKGIVLASLIKFKQICNHPDQYLSQDEFKKDNSGKFLQLEQICETICERRERVLVFTQFREMTEPLADFLEGIFHKRGFVLHGGTPVKKRSEMVEAFNGETYIPYMILSLKAGGVGLNLTAANHVVHFDRWWNPAVENQATDRVFRIGQKKNVVVHKFITQGTVEEKIDAMIEEKQKLAGDILGASGETWITDLDNSQLMDLFRLGGEMS